MRILILFCAFLLSGHSGFSQILKQQKGIEMNSVGDTLLTTVDCYDRDGHLEFTEETNYRGNLEHYFIFYYYNQKGLLSKEVNSWYGMNGRDTNLVIHFSDTLISSIIYYEYDSMNRLILENEVSRCDTIDKSNTIRYIYQGNLLVEKVQTDSCELWNQNQVMKVSKTTFEYDENDSLIHKETCGSYDPSKFIESIYFNYDDLPEKETRFTYKHFGTRDTIMLTDSPELSYGHDGKLKKEVYYLIEPNATSITNYKFISEYKNGRLKTSSAYDLKDKNGSMKYTIYARTHRKYNLKHLLIKEKAYGKSRGEWILMNVTNYEYLYY